MAGILAREIYMATGIALPTAAGRPAHGEIALRLDGALARESHVLTVTKAGVAIAGLELQCSGHGTVTLLQSLVGNDKAEIVIPAYTVKDWCAATYNAFMLDIARQPHSLGRAPPGRRFLPLL